MKSITESREMCLFRDRVDWRLAEVIDHDPEIGN